MDNFRGFEEDVDLVGPADDDPAMDAPPEIGVDERRMHVRAYNHWVSLLDGRPYPSINDLDPCTIDDFGPHSVLLDFSTSSDNPAISFIGGALRQECALASDVGRISDVPSRSLLSRLTDHYLQIIANCAPIGFEAEFVNQRDRSTMYRGILMPFSAHGDTIDFIYGVINWKELADSLTSAELATQVDRAIAAAPAVSDCPVWADGPNAEYKPEYVAPLESAEPPSDDDMLELSLWPSDGEDLETPERGLAPDAGLGDRLCLARETAAAARNADHRSRGALYKALGNAYDFALAAESQAENYAEILEDAGIVAQQRAPMTPVVKLVFGADYDKTRVTEFAAALSWARREALPQGALCAYLEAYAGGLKGVVQAERRARRPEPAPDVSQAARAALRSAPALGFVEIGGTTGEFVLLIARREEDGRLAIVAPVANDEPLIDRAIRKRA